MPDQDTHSISGKKRRIGSTRISSACAVLLGCLLATPCQAESVEYLLDHVILQTGSQLLGRFTWVYDPGDFENGSGDFTWLDVPYSSHDETDLDWTIEVNGSIEITLPANLHDDGVDITLKFQYPLTPTTSAPINPALSKYEIGGNGFHSGGFLSGTIVPLFDTDGDGHLDIDDNCPDDANALQEDNEGDGIGDVCDPDDDNDGRPDTEDSDPYTPAPNACIYNNTVIGPLSVGPGEVIDCRAQTSITTDGLNLVDAGGDLLLMSQFVTLSSFLEVVEGAVFRVVTGTEIAE